MTSALERRLAGWVRREHTVLAADRPAAGRALTAVWRRPERVLVPLAAVMGGALGAAVDGGDALWFREAGVGMLTSTHLDVFSDGGLQIGPLYLAGLGAVTLVLGAVGGDVLARAVLGALQAGLLVWLACGTARRAAARTGASALPAAWAVGTALVLGGFTSEGIGNGHPEELLVGLLLAEAALLAAGGRHARAGVVVGLALALKQWAAFGVPVLLIGRDLRRTARGALVAAVVVAVVYLPFHLWGDVRTYDMRWGGFAASGLTVLVDAALLDGWGARVLQGAAAGLAAAAVAWWRPTVPLLPVIVAIDVRLLLDPLRLTYYSGPLVAVVLVWLWTSRHPSLQTLRLPATLLTPLVVLAPYLLPLRAAWWVGSLLLVALLVLAAATARSGSASSGSQDVPSGAAGATGRPR